MALSSKVDSETYTVMFEWNETSCSVPKMYVTPSDLIVILIDIYTCNTKLMSNGLE